MKKLLLTLGIAGLMAINSHASLILSNSFAYPDGSLTNVSAGSPLGVWTNHSGSGTLDVSGGKVLLSQANAPDVSSGLTGGPYTTNGYLYASFKVNFSALPLGIGTYFWHFKNSGNDFRARVFASITGAGAGTFRVGIAAGTATAIFIPVDLSLGSEYKLVVRYNTTNALSTLWISPTSEAAITSRADSTDIPLAPVAPPIIAVSFRQSGSNPGMGVLTVDDLLVGTAFTDVQTIGGPPSISGLVNVSIPASSSTTAMPFLISDVETPLNSLTLAAYSSNAGLAPSPSSFTFGGSGGSRTLTVTPVAAAQGTSVIDVVVTDGSALSATNTFTITVGAPTNTVIGPIAFTVGDNETSPGLLTVSATSSNTAVIADTDINIQNLGGGSRTISLTNFGTAGITEITVTVSDGTHNVSKKFLATSYPLIGLVLGDDFSYADGSLTNNTLNFWASHSGTTGADLLNGKLLLYATNSADVNAFLTNTPYAASGGFVFYSRFVVSHTTLPTATGTGEYFAHFKEFGNNQLRGRVFTTTNGAASGHYRIGISSGGFVTTTFPWDLTPGASYVVISRYNVASSSSRLWISPVNESSLSVDSTDLTAPVTIYSYAFRQNAGIGALSVDSLAVGTSFSDVQLNIIPSAAPLTIQQSGTNAILTWSNPVFAFQSATNVVGPYISIPTATSPFTNPISGDQKYFRLKY